MSTIQVGQTVPEATFPYVAYDPSLADTKACGVPTQMKTSDWQGKKVVVFAIPGAFTPTCSANHVPPFLEKAAEIKAKGVDLIACVSANDPFVNSAFGRVNGAQDEIVFLTDTYAAWSQAMGLDVDLTSRGLGVRTARYALILDDLKVKYVGKEDSPAEVKVSSADVVLSKL